MTATTSTTTTIAATTRGRRIIIRKNKTCEKCGIERKTMHTRQDQNLLFAWAEPYQDLCPYCYLQEEAAKARERLSSLSIPTDVSTTTTVRAKRQWLPISYLDKP